MSDTGISEEALAELGDVYLALAGDIKGVGVQCDLRGLCCDFDRSGEVLMATDLEIQFSRKNGGHDPALVPHGACPWFQNGTCGLRQGRPLGCRTYYCDPEHTEETRELAESYHRKVVGIHERYGIPYRYTRFVDAVRKSD